MKFYFLLVVSIVISLVASGSFASALPTDRRDGQAKSQAWFVYSPTLGADFVKICAEASTPEEADEIVWDAHFAHAEWVRYFYRDVPRRPLQPGEPGFRHYGRVLASCDGSEDLKIYYGVENDQVRAARALYDNPAGFAHLENYDESTGTGKGFIWIDRSPEILFHPRHRLALMIHEMGHAFGLDHVPGTIMDENISGLLQEAYLTRTPLTPPGPVTTDGEPLGQNWIDLKREAVAWSVIRIPAVREIMQEGSDRDLAFTMLTGNEVRGFFQLRFLDKYAWRDETDNYTETGKGMFKIIGNSCLNPSVLMDGRWRVPCEWKFKVVYGPVVEFPVGDQQLFRRVFRGQVFSRPLLSSMQTGYLLDARGNKWDFVISRNFSEKLDFSLLLNGEKLRLY
jgi:hypothetical protein